MSTKKRRKKTRNGVDTLQWRLREAARARGVTETEARTQIQKLTGVSRATMTHWWRGPAIAPRGGKIVEAARYLGVNPIWLAEGTGSMRSRESARHSRVNIVEQALESIGEAIALIQDAVIQIQDELARIDDDPRRPSSEKHLRRDR